MQRTYWYKIRRLGIIEFSSMIGWQTTLEPESVLAKLKEDYGNRLALVYYEEDDKQVTIYSDLR